VYRGTKSTDQPAIRSAKFPQKYFQEVAFFRAQQTANQNTTTHHDIITISPQKTIQKTHDFPQLPSKTPEFTSKKATQPGGLFF
jgi:hypothetical protein